MVGSSNYNKVGSYNVICDRCGQKRKREQCRTEWTGLLTCTQCWDPKHPWNEPLPIVVDGLPVKDARPRPQPKEINVEIITSIWGQQYLTKEGIKTDVNWEDWDTNWDADTYESILWSPENFPLR